MEMEASQQDLFGMWRPSSLPVLEQVQSKQIPVTIILSHGFNGKSLAVQLKGIIAEISNNVFIYHVQSQKTIPTTAPAKLSQGMIVADIFFNMALQKPNGVVEPMGYSGEGTVVNVITDAEGKAKTMHLKVGHAFQTRRMRRDDRYDWREDIPATLGLDVLDVVPQTRVELKSVLENCVANGRRIPFSNFNISAGGVCLKINPTSVRTNTSSLYFFLLTLKQDASKPAIPFFLLCKRLGLHYQKDSQEADGIRMQFIHELDWTNSQDKLTWSNIEKTGSSGLRTILSFLWNNNTAVQPPIRA